MKRIIIAATLLLALAGCGGKNDDITMDGQRFDGRVSTERGDRAAFVATGGPASASLEGAREAARYEAIKHCISYLGTSDIAWVQGPDAEDAALAIDRDRVILSGRCIETGSS